jgi:hypothetical protein
MPYEGEYARYHTVSRITESERVKQLLGRARVYSVSDDTAVNPPESAPEPPEDLPRLVVAIDGSNLEVDVQNGYPGAKIGYCTVACVLIDLALVEKVDVTRPFDPVRFRETERAATVDAAIPGSNVVTRRQTSAVASFREELYDLFDNVVLDEEDKSSLRETYEILLATKPMDNIPACPYKEVVGCSAELTIRSGHGSCLVCGGDIYSTDALRIHERFKDLGTNSEAFTYVMQVWERVFLVHLLRIFEKRGMWDQLEKIAFFLDGPLAVFGTPAWLSASIQRELMRMNAVMQEHTGKDLLILGIEKSGGFVTHFEEIDETETRDTALFAPRTYLLPTDDYIKKRILQTQSEKRYGADTYFGRKFFYKTANHGRIVASLPFLSSEQDTLESEDIALYPRFPTVCDLLDKLVSSRYPNALSPIVSAHAQAAIPLQIGTKVLQQLAKAMMRQE